MDKRGREIMYQDWMEKIPVTGTIEDVPEEKEYPHIIEEIKHVYIYGLPPNVEMVDDRVTTLEEKINEIIQVVNIMMRGGLR